MTRKLNLKEKLLLILAGFLAVVLAALWIFGLVFFKNFYKAVKLYKIEEDARVISLNVDDANLNALIDRISYSDGISVAIIDFSGTVVYSAYASYSVIERLSPASLIEKTEAAKGKGKYVETVAYPDFTGDGYDPEGLAGRVPGKNSGSALDIIYATNIAAADGVEYGLLLEAVIAPDVPMERMMILLLSVATVFILSAMLAVGFVFSRSVVKPIESLTESAKELAKGKSGVVFEGGGYREIDELRDSLNYASREISEVDNLRRELISNVSHDLKTPLTLIKGYSEMMRDIPSEATPDNIQVIIDETERLAGLVSDMLDLSKIEETKELALEELDFSALVSEIVARLSKFLGHKGYKLLFEAQGEVYVLADRMKISQVVYNLLSNAVNYSGEDKEVMVRLFEKNKNARLEIEDRGEGIDVSILPHIWDRYYKSEKAHRRASVGTGLGLSIVKSVMSAHPGGVYGVRSTVGEGSTFYIELPRVRHK